MQTFGAAIFIKRLHPSQWQKAGILVYRQESLAPFMRMGIRVFIEHRTLYNVDLDFLYFVEILKNLSVHLAKES